MKLNLRTTLVGLTSLACVPAEATYSIVMIDTETGEIGVFAATCEFGYDLAALVPVIRVGRGAACAQSGGDWSGARRKVIWDELAQGTDPTEILAILSKVDPGHETHQYGIVDVQGRATAFTGTLCGYGHHRSGQVGTIHYAVSGNGLPGDIVIDAAEAALIAAPGGLADKLLAGMEAAAAMGGDGRCSCSPFFVTMCGAPPEPPFQKSAHIGFMIVSRPGDQERACPPTEWCDPPEYYLMLNITDGRKRLPDPVAELRESFERFRGSMVGVPDGVESRVTLAPEALIAGSGATSTLTVEVRDWRGLPVTDFRDVLVTHDPGAGQPVTQIGPIVEKSPGLVRVELLAGAAGGSDRFLIEVEAADGRRVRVARSPTLKVTAGDDPKSGGQQSGEGGEPGSEPPSGEGPSGEGPSGPHEAPQSEAGVGEEAVGGESAVPVPPLLCPLAALLLSAASAAGVVGRRTIRGRRPMHR